MDSSTGLKAMTGARCTDLCITFRSWGMPNICRTTYNSATKLWHPQNAVPAPGKSPCFVGAVGRTARLQIKCISKLSLVSTLGDSLVHAPPRLGQQDPHEQYQSWIAHILQDHPEQMSNDVTRRNMLEKQWADQPIWWSVMVTYRGEILPERDVCFLGTMDQGSRQVPELLGRCCRRPPSPRHLRFFQIIVIITCTLCARVADGWENG